MGGYDGVEGVSSIDRNDHAYATGVEQAAAEDWDDRTSSAHRRRDSSPPRVLKAEATPRRGRDQDGKKNDWARGEGGGKSTRTGSSPPPSPEAGEVRSVAAGGWGEATSPTDGVHEWGLQGHPAAEGFEVEDFPLRGREPDKRTRTRTDWGTPKTREPSPENGGWGAPAPPRVRFSEGGDDVGGGGMSRRSTLLAAVEPRKGVRSSSPRTRLTRDGSIDREKKAGKAHGFRAKGNGAMEGYPDDRRKPVSAQEQAQAAAPTPAHVSPRPAAATTVAAQEGEVGWQQPPPSAGPPPSRPPPPLPPSTHPPSLPPPTQPLSAAASAYRPARRVMGPPPGMTAGASGGSVMPPTSPEWMPMLFDPAAGGRVGGVDEDSAKAGGMTGEAVSFLFCFCFVVVVKEE